jgi:tripartite-type tricarboxylate transporter receptor subunit TctC
MMRTAIGRRATLGGLAAIAASRIGRAQAYPTRPIRWICAWTPGGANDLVSRMLADDLSRRLGQPVTVENRSGAGGTIGTDAVAKAAPDGYTLTLGAPGTHSTAPSIVPNLPYDPLRDFTPVSLVARVPNVLVVRADMPVDTVAALIARGKAASSGLSYASVGNGSMQHLSGAVFGKAAGLSLVHVPYRGTAPALVDLVGGRIDFAFESMAGVLPLVRDGKLRPLAVTTPVRSSLMPEVPTMAEAGVPAVEVSIWLGVFGPGGMPAPVVQVLNQAIVAGLQAPEARERLRQLGADPVGSSPEELGRFLASEITRWAAVIRQEGLRAD